MPTNTELTCSQEQFGRPKIKIFCAISSKSVDAITKRQVKAVYLQEEWMGAILLIH